MDYENWNFNMHWISPAEEKTQLEFLRALGDGGLDESVNTIGTELGLDGLSAFHSTFIERGFNLITPLFLSRRFSTRIGCTIRCNDTVKLKYEYNTGILNGDEAYHATAPIDYTATGIIRVMATVFFGDINHDNVENILKAYSQNYPPADTDWLLANAGEHWPSLDRIRSAR